MRKTYHFPTEVWRNSILFNAAILLSKNHKICSGFGYGFPFLFGSGMTIFGLVQRGFPDRQGIYPLLYPLYSQNIHYFPPHYSQDRKKQEWHRKRIYSKLQIYCKLQIYRKYIQTIAPRILVLTVSLPALFYVDLSLTQTLS